MVSTWEAGFVWKIGSIPRPQRLPRATPTKLVIWWLLPIWNMKQQHSKLNRDTLVGHVGSIFSLSPKEKAALLRPYFGCESDLINLLLQSGFQESRILDLFWKHRQGYLCPIDFARIRSLGIRKVRLPLTWCINYDKPYRIKGKTFEGQDQEVIIGTHAALVNDPLRMTRPLILREWDVRATSGLPFQSMSLNMCLRRFLGQKFQVISSSMNLLNSINFIHKGSDHKNDKRWGRRRMMSRIKTSRNNLLSSYKEILGQMRCFTSHCLSKSDVTNNYSLIIYIYICNWHIIILINLHGV